MCCTDIFKIAGCVFVCSCAMSMYSCEIRVGDIKEMSLEKKNGEKALLTSIKNCVGAQDQLCMKFDIPYLC